MKVAVGSDHAGFHLKEHVRVTLVAAGHDVVDVGTRSAESVDYPRFAEQAARLVSGGAADRAVLACGSGVGVSIVANKVAGVRAVNAHDPAEAERNKLSAYRGFWSITLGGAEGLYIDDLVGNFAPGKEADFVVLDCNGGPPALAWRQSLIAEDGKPPTLEQAADLLFGLMTVGDDRAIDQTWAMGRQVYLRRGSN